MESLQINENRSERIIGIDLLKIVSMIMMVALHIIGTFGIIGSLENFTYKLCAVLFFPTRCAVNCYALASGFLSVNKKNKPSRILYIWIQTFVYSFLIAVLCKILFPETIAIREVAGYALPILSVKYWYVSAYFGLFLLMPLLNEGIKQLPQKIFKILLISVLSIISISAVLNRVVFSADPFTIGNGMTLLWLIITYLVGAYIKLYGKPLTDISLAILIPVFVLVNAINITIYFICASRGLNYKFIYYYDFPTVLISSLCLFLMFLKIKTIRNQFFKKIIISFSTATLGVYLLHIHPLVYDNLLVKLNFIVKYNNVKFILLLFAAVFGVYILCSLIDIVRAYIFKIIKIDSLCKRIDKNFGGKNDIKQ